VGDGVGVLVGWCFVRCVGCLAFLGVRRRCLVGDVGMLYLGRLLCRVLWVSGGWGVLIWACWPDSC